MSDSFGLPRGGQRIVVADRASRITGREIVIPGLRAHPDALPRNPSPWDVEFSAPTLKQGYQLIGTPTAWDYNTTVKSHLWVSQGASAGYAGPLWPTPPTPFTVTCKMASTVVTVTGAANSQQPGLCLSTATPSTGSVGLLWVGPDGSGNPRMIIQALGTNTATTNGYGLARPVYLRFVVTSTSNVAAYFSFNGLRFIPIVTGANPGFTIGSVGPVVRAPGTPGCEASYLWMRFTRP